MNELPKPIKIEEQAAIQEKFLAPYVEGVARQQRIEFARVLAARETTISSEVASHPGR